MTDCSFAPPSALLAFVLRHAQVTTNVCSRQKSEQGYRLAPRTVPDHNLIFVTRGQVVWTVADEPLELGPGDLAIVPPAVPHHAHSRTRRITLGSVHLEVRLAGGQDVFELLTPPRRQHVLPDSRLDRYLRAAIDEFDRPTDLDARLMLRSWGRLIALELLGDNAARGLLHYRPLDPLVTALMEELSRRLDRPTTLEELAEWAGFSAQHLNRVFRRHIGTTPLRHLTRLRMDHAAGLLMDGRLTVRAIALRVGYTDPYHFSRAFKQHLGLSPTQYQTAAHAPADSDYPSSGSRLPFPVSPSRR